jgi:hypothetical protein
MAVKQLEFVVPNPMSNGTGKTRDGKPSTRCLDNVKERWFLVIEFHDLRLESQEKLLWHLGKLRRLVMVVYSGRKSLHGWFEVRGDSEEGSMEFFRYAVSLGADKEMRKLCQWTRIPRGTNSRTGNEQTLLYYDF